MASIFGRLLGNFSESSAQELTDKYGAYLMSEERIQTGFKLVRDTVLMTDVRLIFIDHQGVTGRKTRVTSIHLDSIYEVTMESAGTGLDDSEITLHYIASPYYRSNNIQVAAHKLEFGKRFNIQPLYVALISIAHENMKRINQ